jgi:gliding motility-associated-like protein
MLRATVAGGTPPYQYLWSSGSNSNLIQSLDAGEYEVTVTDGANCTTTGIMTMIQPPALEIQGIQTDLTCFGLNNGSASAIPGGGTPPYTHQWNTGAGQESLTGLAAGTYAVTVTDNRNCTSIRTFSLAQPTLLQLEHAIVEPTCHSEKNGSISVAPSGGTPPYVFVWNSGQTSSNITGLSGGLYLVTITDGNHCTETAAFSLPAVTIPQTTLGADLLVELGEEITLTAYSNLSDALIKSYSWEGDAGSLLCPDCRRYRFVPIENGCQQVHIITPEGCEATDEVCYQVTARRNVYFPNVFSPDDDGQNDYFHPFTDASVRIIRYMSVFDRWGEKVFHRENMEPNDPSDGWDGYFRGETMNNAVFVWVAEVEFIDGQIRTYKGDVTIIR